MRLGHAVSSIRELVQGRLAAVRLDPREELVVETESPSLLVPGSFNPLHAGHLGLARCAEARRGCQAAFELSIVNVEKPPLDEPEIHRRAEQFAGVAPLWLTRAATFLEKARLFPGVEFVVGLDTAIRVVERRFYASRRALVKALGELRDLGCRFLVAGRLLQQRYQTLADVAMPAAYADLFEPLDFRLDLSSTELRHRSG